ncbi:hypothetical protein [uncultured Salinibacterium sp.]|uniref:hypothetical protein n=1 Tax=uncultured Salinibacterium sp. TaxID=459274 RepID=UPI0030DCFA28
MNKITTPIHRAARIGATIAAVLFTLVTLFQLAVVLGAPLGEYTQGGGTKARSPLRAASLRASLPPSFSSWRQQCLLAPNAAP